MNLLYTLIMRNFPPPSTAMTESQQRHLKELQASLALRKVQRAENFAWNKKVQRRNKRFAETGLNQADRIAAGLQ